MSDAATISYELPAVAPPESAAEQFVVTVRVTAPAGQSARAAHQFAEVLHAVLLARQQMPPEPATAAPGHGQGLEIHVPYRAVRVAGAEVALTRLEFDLLLYLAREPGRVFARSTLLADVWHLPDSTSNRTVDVHIRRLRSKLGRRDHLISTVRRVGYRFERSADVTLTE